MSVKVIMQDDIVHRLGVVVRLTQVASCRIVGGDLVTGFVERNVVVKAAFVQSTLLDNTPLTNDLVQHIPVFLLGIGI